MLLKLFLACGGLALVASLMLKNSREGLRKTLDFIFDKFPALKKLAKDNAEFIEKEADELEAGFKEAIEDQKNAPSETSKDDKTQGA